MYFFVVIVFRYTSNQKVRKKLEGFSYMLPTLSLELSFIIEATY
jgi:hypothetical protein